MHPDEARNSIINEISVDPHMVRVAKQRFIQSGSGWSSSSGLINILLADHQIPNIEPLNLAYPNTIRKQISDTARHISWTRAGVEAIWSLIHDNVFIPSKEFDRPRFESIGWTTMTPGGSGSGAAWNDFGQFDIPVPTTLMKAPSLAGDPRQAILYSPGLYLEGLKISCMNDEVAQALQEAVACFRHELFGPAAAMLGKASEGAWLETGKSLVRATPSDQQSSIAKQADAITGSRFSTPAKIEAIKTLYDRDFFKSIYGVSAVKPQDLREAIQWSENVRDSRNAIHFGNAAAFPNDSTKVSMLLLGAAVPLRQLYAIKSAADALPA